MIFPDFFETFKIFLNFFQNDELESQSNFPVTWALAPSSIEKSGSELVTGFRLVGLETHSLGL